MRILVATLAVALAGICPGAATAQSGGAYTLKWHNLSSGGGRAAGGVYQHLGVLGQPDAVTVGAGLYQLAGGFLTPRSVGPTEVRNDPVPRAFAFRLPVPNPARENAVFAVELPRAARVTLAIFSVDGRRVRNLMDARQDAGYLRIAWDRRTDAGARVPAGVYLARAEADGVASSHRFVVLD